MADLMGYEYTLTAARQEGQLAEFKLQLFDSRGFAIDAGRLTVRHYGGPGRIEIVTNAGSEWGDCGASEIDEAVRDFLFDPEAWARRI